MYFSKESRYRNFVTGEPSYYEPRRRNLFPVVIVGAVLVVCCACAGVVIGLALNGRPLSMPNPVAEAPKATSTPDLKSVIPIKGKGLNENGLELGISSFQRPLQVQGLKQIAADQQFVLVSVLIHNTKTSGAPLPLNPADFKIKGEGGLTYEANPKTVTIENLMTAQDAVAPGKDMERELIFQIAKDDTGLKLYWTVGKTTRVFFLEAE